MFIAEVFSCKKQFTIQNNFIELAYRIDGSRWNLGESLCLFEQSRMWRIQFGQTNWTLLDSHIRFNNQNHGWEINNIKAWTRTKQNFFYHSEVVNSGTKKQEKSLRKVGGSILSFSLVRPWRGLKFPKLVFRKASNLQFRNCFLHWRQKTMERGQSFCDTESVTRKEPNTKNTIVP